MRIANMCDPGLAARPSPAVTPGVKVRAWARVSVVVGVCVGACGEPEPVFTPVPFERPEVVWVEGPPEGPWEDDPWVVALREFHYESSIAWNALNFTDPALAEVASDGMIGSLAWFAGRSAEKPYGYSVDLGPLPSTVMEVKESADGKSAEVTTCDLIGWDMSVSSWERTAPIEDGFPTVWVLHLDSDGHRRVQSSDIPKEPDCTGVPAAYGRFDPAPVPPPERTYTADDVIVPPLDDDD